MSINKAKESVEGFQHVDYLNPLSTQLVASWRLLQKRMECHYSA